MAKFTFGSDPEFMIVENDQLKSAIGILPSKETPKQFSCGDFYYDNVLAEIATEPGQTRSEVIENIQEVLRTLAALIKPAKFIIRASAEYSAKELKTEQAKIAGCNPEWSVYTHKVIEPPDKMVDFRDGYWYFKVPFRTAGGHIHLGSTLFDDVLAQFNVIRMMDLFISIPSIFMDTDPTSKERRKAYGTAGSHRTPEDETVSRIEYRPLGNFWFSSPEHVGLIYDLTNFVMGFVENKDHEKFWSLDEQLFAKKPDAKEAHICTGYDVTALRKCINTCDRNQAEKFMLIVNNFLPEELSEKIEKLSGQDLPDPYEAWRLENV